MGWGFFEMDFRKRFVEEKKVDLFGLRDELS